MKTKVKFDFDQLNVAIISFAADLEKKMCEIVDEIPVYVNYTGDSNYMMNTKYKEVENKEVHAKIPRIVLSLQGDINIAKENDTQHGNIVEYKYLNDVLKASMRRSELGVNIRMAFTTSNIIDCLQSIVISLAVLNRPNAMTYSYMGCNMELSYSYDNNVSTTIPQYDATNKNFVAEFALVIKPQLFVPRVESIKGYKEGIAETVKLEIR